MAPLGKIAQGADKADDLVKALWKRAKESRKQVNINRAREGYISFTTATGTASATTNLPYDMQMALLKLNNGDTFTRTIADSKIHDGMRMHGEQIIDQAKGVQVENLWKAFLDRIFG